MKIFNSGEIQQIRDIVNEHLNNSTIVHSIQLTVSKPVVRFGDVGSQLEDLILYNVEIQYGENGAFYLKNIDLSEDVRDAAAILTDQIEDKLK